MPTHSCVYCQNCVLVPIDDKVSENEAECDTWGRFTTFEFSEEEVRAGAQCGCAFFQTCTDKLDAFRKLSFCCAPRRLRGRIKLGYDVTDIEVHWTVDPTSKVKWLGSESEHYTFGVLSQEGYWVVPCRCCICSNNAEGDNAAKFVSGRVGARKIASKNDFEVYRSWLTTCFNKHDSWPDDKGGWRPPNLVKINWDSHQANPTLRLVPGQSILGTNDYVAVSYCWGTKSCIDPLLTELKKDKWNIPFRKVPRTLQDTIVVAYKLDFRYIWIDCLCIAQNDPAEFALGISNLSRTFAGAALVVSAARANSSDRGILHPLQIPDVDAQRFRIPYACPDGPQGFVILYERPNERLRTDPIEDRSWCFQEHILARRILRFGSLAVSYFCCDVITRRGVRWESRLSQSDGNHNADRRALASLIQSTEDNEQRRCQLWEHLVSESTSRKLGLLTDRLPAFAGIAEIFYQLCPDEYLAGLWRKQLPKNLLWQCGYEASIRVPGQPSWSWCSLEAGVSVGSHTEHLVDSELEILDCIPTLKHKDARFGQVVGGTLLIKGNIRAVRLSADVFREPLVAVDGQGQPCQGALRMMWHRDVPEANDEGVSGELGWCLQICRYGAYGDIHEDENEGDIEDEHEHEHDDDGDDGYYGGYDGPCGLVLIQRSESVYKRIGIFSPWDNFKPPPAERKGCLAVWEMGYETKTITII